MGCQNPRSQRRSRGFERIIPDETHLPVHLVLLVLALLLDHEDGMIEEVDLQLGALALRASALLQRSLEDELALFVTEPKVLYHRKESAFRGRERSKHGTLPTHNCLAVLEDELLIELREVEAILALARLDIDAREELSHELDDLGQRNLVRVVVGRVLQAGVEQERVPGQPGRRLGQVAVQLELARLG